MQVDIPTRVLPILAQIEEFYMTTVKPFERQLGRRLKERIGYLDQNGRIHPEVQRVRRSIMEASARAGLYSLHLPTDIGGGGLSRYEMFFVEEKVYGYGLGLNPAVLAWTDGATPRLIFCDSAHRREFVDPLVRGLKTSLNGVTEPGAGSNFFDMTTTAIRRGRDWYLTGHKYMITNAFEADIAQVFAVTDPGKGRASFTYFQFNTRQYLGKGYRTGEVARTMFDDGLTGEIMFDNLRLPTDSVIGDRAQGFDIAMCSIGWTRMRRAGMCSGWSKYIIDKTVARVRDRLIGGRPLGGRQGIQWMVADMYLDWAQAKALSLQYLRQIDTPGPWWKVPQTTENIRAISLIKLANDEAFFRIADRAVQIYGGSGLMKNNEINRLFLIARNLRVPGGSDEVQRTTIAETLGLGK